MPDLPVEEHRHTEQGAVTSKHKRKVPQSPPVITGEGRDDNAADTPYEHNWIE